MDKYKLIQELFQKIEVLTSRLEQAEKEIAALKSENEILKSRLNSNSNNSSKPPSSDGYQKRPAFPKTGKGKQGGQTWHKGRTLNQVNNPDNTITCNPVSCSCGHTFTSAETALTEKRQVFDLPEPRLEVTEYRIYKAVCPVCGMVHRGAAPEGVNAPVQYGNRVKAYVTLLNVRWGSYFKFDGLSHSICGAHILRELEGLIENDKSQWAKIFTSFLMDVYKMPFEERLKQRQYIGERYKLICGIGEKSEPPPIKTPGKRGRNKRTKGRNLMERLICQQDAVFAFAFNKNVPFTNNLAERDIGPAKVKQKISNSFRTVTGADIYARIEGFVSTARKNNRNVFSELCATFEGRNFITG